MTKKAKKKSRKSLTDLEILVLTLYLEIWSEKGRIRKISTDLGLSKRKIRKAKSDGLLKLSRTMLPLGRPA